MSYVFAPNPQTALPIAASDELFPVHRIYCIGRNYGAHAREMGHDPDREPPFFFLKPADTIIVDGTFPYPPASTEVHHEIEMVVALHSGGTDISEDDALSHIFGYGVGLDMTRRDLQGVAKKTGRPWAVGKAFEHSAPCSPIHPATQIGHPADGSIWLDVNNERRQLSDLEHMIWSVSEQISQISRLFELRAGDLIMTGTPAGVGPVSKGDRLLGGVTGIGELSVLVV